jgi:hypothetical protein
MQAGFERNVMLHWAQALWESVEGVELSRKLCKHRAIAGKQGSRKKIKELARNGRKVTEIRFHPSRHLEPS